jgi:hypothetical protein
LPLGSVVVAISTLSDVVSSSAPASRPRPSHGGELVLEIVEVECQQPAAGPIGACYELDHAACRNVPLGETLHW